jgi:hypothetical protein
LFSAKPICVEFYPLSHLLQSLATAPLVGPRSSMRRGKAPASASMPKDRRGTCARRITPHLPRCCLTSFCAPQGRPDSAPSDPATDISAHSWPTRPRSTDLGRRFPMPRRREHGRMLDSRGFHTGTPLGAGGRPTPCNTAVGEDLSKQIDENFLKNISEPVRWPSHSTCMPTGVETGAATQNSIWLNHPLSRR